MSEALGNAASFFQTWSDVLAQVLAEITSASFPCTLLPQAPSDLAPPADTDQWVIGAWLGGLRGEMSVRLSAASASRLAQVFMGEAAASEAEVGAQHRDAVVELLRQAGGFVATALQPSWGELQLRIDPSSAAPSWPAASTVWLQVGESATTAPVIELALSAALEAGLHPKPPDAAQPAVPLPSRPAPAEPEQGKAKLDLLMDVELDLTLRFGSRQMALREILDLNPGSVVALDRQIEDPVDLVLDGRIVARGEIVVLDGNYGVRVTEVAQPVV